MTRRLHLNTIKIRSKILTIHVLYFLGIPDTWQVDIKDDFTCKLLSSLLQRHESAAFTDFTITVGKARIPCHRLILSSMCPYFEALLEAGMKEAENREACLDPFDEVIVRSVVGYIYGGRMTLKWENIEQIIELCDFLQLTELKEECGSFVCSKITPANCIRWLQISEQFNMADVNAASKSVLAIKFVEVGCSEDFKLLSLEQIIDVIKIEDIPISQDRRLEAVIGWIRCDQLQRRGNFENILTHINLHQCSPSYLKHLLSDAEDLIVSFTIFKNIIFYYIFIILF